MPRSFRPTDEQRQKVKWMAGFGVTHEQIATLLGLGSAVTLRKHFPHELTRGPIEANANVRKTLFKMAKSGRNPGATMYWLKTRARWSEKGTTPEPVENRPEKCTWFVSVYQPPRPPEEEQQLREAAEVLGGTAPECEEWEDWEQPPVGAQAPHPASPPG